jgi:heavy metal sensor kinase
MTRSIRWRLQGWYAVVLLLVVSGFAGLLYSLVHAALFQEIDAGLVAAAHYLDAHLRRFPSRELDGRPATGGSPSPGLHGRLNRPAPPSDSQELRLNDLTLPGRSGPAEGASAPNTYFAVWRADGSRLKASHLPGGDSFPASAGALPPAGPRVTQHEGFREVSILGPRRTQILVGRSVQKELAELHTLVWQLAAAGAVVLVVGLAGGWLVSARILQPVGAIAATASAISITNLSERIDPAAVERELEELAHVLNATFDRLEAAFERQARFTADASHELRTPLAIIRSHAQLALGRPRSADEYRRAVTACLHASDRMAALVDGLLILARADAGKFDLEQRPVDLRRLTEETLALFRPLAAGQDVSLAANLRPALVLGDAGRLAQVLTNLLNNAVRYNRPGGTVRVRLGTRDNAVALTVADTGRGIPEADRSHVFERFYRADAARSRASGGTGLGLAICKTILEAHGGLIAFTSELDQGTTFEVRLPRCHVEGDRLI